MELLNFHVVAEFWPVFLVGLGVTVSLTATVAALTAALAVPVALARLSPHRRYRWPASVYVEVARSTPLLLQLIYIYYVLPEFGIRLGAYTAATIGLTLNYTAYTSEVYRGGILAVPLGQRDAAAALGLSGRIAFRKVILPQAVRIILPSLGNYLISLFKDTALASVVTVQELMFTGQIISARTYQYFTTYTIAGVLYLAVGYPTSLALGRIEAAMESGGGAGWRKR
jgi:His/Glu/Gln/Arg/opine family amino acid ABC transporter permease subunit